MKTIILTILTTLSLNAFGATKYYISAGGNNTDGKTLATAWTSVTKLNSMWGTVVAGDTVYFADGQTFSGTVTIGKSGAVGKPIVITTSASNPAKLTSLIPLNSAGWSNTSYTNVKVNSQVLSLTPKFLIKNNGIAPLSRFPNKGQTSQDGYQMASSVSGTTVTDKSFTLSSGFNWANTESNYTTTAVIKCTHFSNDKGPVTSFSQTGSTATFTYTQGSGAPPAPGYGWFFTNNPKACDQEGEYAVSKSNTICMYSASNIAVQTVQAPSLAVGINTNSKSYITISNLKIEGFNDQGISISGGTNVSVQNCSIKFNGLAAILTSSCSNVDIGNNTLDQNVNDGINAKANGANSLHIYNNKIYNSGTDMAMCKGGGAQAEGIVINGYENTVVEYNDIQNSGLSGVRFTEMDVATIQYNYLKGNLMTMDDAGQIYTIEETNKFFTTRKRIIRGNICDYPSVMGHFGTPHGTQYGLANIYLDNYSTSTTIQDNLVLGSNLGIYLHRTINVVLLNNKIYDCNDKPLYWNNDKGNVHTGFDVTGNLVFLTNSTANPLTVIGTMMSGSSFQRNTYLRPIKPAGFAFRLPNQNLSFAQWQSTYGYDVLGSTITPAQAFTGTDVASNVFKVVYNAAQTTNTFALDNKNWIAQNGTTYKSNAITLSPYSFEILMLISGKPTGGNISPAVSITSPASNAVYTQPINLTISANASDADGSISKVDFYNENTLLGTDNTSPYSYSFNNMPAGSYLLTAKATDNLGATTVSNTVAVTVNSSNVPPSVNIASPINNASFLSPASINITANASDNDGAVTKVDFYNGSSLIGTSTASPFSLSWQNVGAGSYSITAKATDNGGAVTTSSPVNISVKGLVAPSVSITSPANQSAFVEPAAIAITATASDVDGSITKVEFYKNGVLINTDVSTPYSYTLTNILKGTDTLMAKAYDNDGLSSTSSVVTFTSAPNKKPPVVGLTGPANGSTYTDPAQIIMSATASDQDGTIAYVNFYANNVLIATDYTPPYTVTYSSVYAGSYSLTAIAKDNDSLTATSSAVNVTITHINQPPTVDILSPASGDSSVVGVGFTMTASATDADGTITKVEFFNGSTLLGTATTAPYTRIIDLPVGTYTLTAKATDNNGATASKDITFKVVNPQPVEPLTFPGHKAVIK